MNHLAFQLKRCQPPPTVLRAEMLAEDEDYEIGERAPLRREAVGAPGPLPPAAVTETPRNAAGAAHGGRLSTECVSSCGCVIVGFCHLKFALVVLSTLSPRAFTSSCFSFE